MSSFFKTTSVKLLRPAALTLIFLVSLFGAGSFLARVRPLADVPVAREKYAHFATHANDYDALFIGTSRVYHGIMPSLFDELTAAAGAPTHSFNFGIDAMRSPEDGFVLENILALHPRKLRWVFVELGPLHTEFGERDPDSVRGVYWHDWARTALVTRGVFYHKGRAPRWRSLLFGSAADRARLGLALTHFRLWAIRTLNLGRAASAINDRARSKHDSAAALGHARDGFAPTPVERMSPQAAAEYERETAARVWRKTDLDPASRRALDRIVADIRRAGAEPVFINSPRLSGSPIFPGNHPDVPVLDFMDVHAWPELFAAENRPDDSHVNSAGAKIYTRAVARRFLEVTRSAAR